MASQELPVTPLRFKPIAMPRIWGGSRLRTLLNKNFADATPIGESWELSGLRGNESIVADGPMAGRTLSELSREYRGPLLGDVVESDHAFPLLIKFLDAQQPLSVQVHPKPDSAAGTAVKHETWYIVHAEPGAEVYIGLKPGVTPKDIADAANTPRMRDLIQTRPASAGDCFYLPSGTLHALGAGLVVAEVQTPSDVTYRIYDWDRVDESGSPRELHIDEALANIRDDVAESEIVQHRRQVHDSGVRRERVCQCERFAIDELTAEASFEWTAGQPTCAVWMILDGTASITGGDFRLDVTTGDTLLVPAVLRGMHIETGAGFKCLEIVPPLRESVAMHAS